MPRKRTHSNIRLAAEDMQLVEKLLKRFKRAKKKPAATQGDLLHFLLLMCDTHGLIKEGWMERLTTALERGNWSIEQEQMEFDSDRCPAIAHGEEKFKCVWGRKGKPPLIRILEKEYGLSKNMCVGCEKTRLPIAENEKHLKRIKVLEKGLESRAREVYKIPVCEGGANLTPDGTGFKKCRRSNTDVDVLRFCKVVEDGPCSYFREIVVGVGEKK